MDEHLGYEKFKRCDNDDYSNGYKHKQINSRYSSMAIEVQQDWLLDEVYPILYIDAIHYSVGDNGEFASWQLMSFWELIRKAGKKS